MSDIFNDGFLPEALEASSVDDFYTLIKSKMKRSKGYLIQQITIMQN